MKRRHSHLDRAKERGVVITLVAVFMLFVVGAMAVLAIDVVTFYTARSEAQLAADGAALAGARVLANSGMTSSTDATLATSAQTLCQTIAKQVALSNSVGGVTPTVVTNACNIASQYNPTVTVKVQASQPTFFARIWGTTQVTVSATATAEAYNPSAASTIPGPAVATTCVKPLLLANTPDPSGTSGTNEVFDPVSGAIQPTGLLGDTVRLGTGGNWRYAAGDTFLNVPPSFPPPVASSVTCNGSAGFNTFQLAVAGCVQTPITCNSTTIHYNSNAAYMGHYGTRDRNDASEAANCLTNTNAGGQGDSVAPTTNPPTAPFEFVAGDNNPLVETGTLNPTSDIFVSDSLVTLPVYAGGYPPATNPVTIVGFVQLFLNPAGSAAPFGGPIQATVINLVGCGTSATGPPFVIGNGPSAVPVRLITQ